MKNKKAGKKITTKSEQKSKTGKQPQKTPAFKNILVTGGAGYVGTATVDLLLSEGYRVRVLDSLRFGGMPIIPFLGRDGFEFIKGDVRSSEDVKVAMQGIDAVIHLAGIVGFPACRKDPELSRDINVGGTRTILEHAGKKVPVLFASTGSNYGKMLEAICTETTPLNPLSDYARQKVEAEELIKAHKEFVIYRFATAFGVSHRLRLDLLPNDFTFRAVRDKNLIVYEKHFMRTFIHVRDMAQSFLFALQNYDKMRGEVYNVGDNRMNYSKEQICNLIREKVNYYLHFADIAKDLDQRDYIVSYEKISKVGFNTRISMEQGIDELIQMAQIVEIPNPHYNV